jgi:hypothetical protein
MKRIYNINQIMLENTQNSTGNGKQKLIKKIKENIQDLLKPKKYYLEFSEIEKIYNAKIPKDVIELYSLTSGGFIKIRDGEYWRILSPKDILEASDDFRVNFIMLKILPLIDCKDNDFICYNFKDSIYEMFHLIDELGFMYKKSLWEYFDKFLK